MYACGMFDYRIAGKIAIMGLVVPIMASRNGGYDLVLAGIILAMLFALLTGFLSPVASYLHQMLQERKYKQRKPKRL